MIVLCWAAAAAVQGVSVLVGVWTGWIPTDAALVVLALLGVLVAGLGARARRPRGRLPAWLPVVALGAGLGACWAMARLGAMEEAARHPPPWMQAMAAGEVPATLTGFLRADEGDRVILDAPCLERLGSEALAQPDCEGPPQLTVVRDPFDHPSQVVPGDMVRVALALRARRAADNPTGLPPEAPGLALWGRAEGPLEPAPDRAAPLGRAVGRFLAERLTRDDPFLGRAGALQVALILGDRRALAPEARHAYQDTGTAHLLAISGMNLAIFGLGALAFARFLLIRLPLTRHHPAPVRPAAWLALAVTFGYAAVILPSDASDRALVALTLGLGGLALGYEVRAGRTLALCVLVALTLDPAALARAGYQLSLAATAGLIASVPATTALAARLRASPHLPTPWIATLAVWLTGLIVADLFTFLATAPISLAWFGQASVHGLWVNVIAIPWMGLLVYPAGLLQLGLAVVAPPLGDLLAPLVAWIAISFETFILTSGEAIGSQHAVAWPAWLGWGACLLGLLAVAPRAGPRLVAMAGGLGLALVLAWWGWTALGPGAARLRVDMLDVGHGDALVLRLPDGGVMVIDAGGAFSDEASQALVERAVVPALSALGVSRIDLLVITHADRDHIGGAEALVARVPVGRLWMPPCAWETALGRRLRERVRAGGGEVVQVAAQPPTAWGEVALEVLWPPAGSLRPDGRCALAQNDASLVLRLAWGGRAILLTGDIEAATEAALVARHGDSLRSDVLKVAHHGSQTSSTAAFLDAVRPRVALVSGRVDDPPRPPQPHVLRDLRMRGLDTWVTGERGAVAVSWGEAGDLAVGARREARQPGE